MCLGEGGIFTLGPQQDLRSFFAAHKPPDTRQRQAAPLEHVKNTRQAHCHCAGTDQAAPGPAKRRKLRDQPKAYQNHDRADQADASDRWIEQQLLTPIWTEMSKAANSKKLIVSRKTERSWV